jgi:hypothetical protein
MDNARSQPISLSIDFGTSNTVASIRRADGRIHQQLFSGAPQLPSAVFLEPEGPPHVGVDAVHSGRRRPDRFEPNPKRRIDDGAVLLGERELTVTELIAAVLGEVRREVVQTVGKPESVTITVPAAWGPTRRHLIADAAEAAGLGAISMVPEPVAAATFFVEKLGNRVPVGSGVVVYDLGGGTFDATALRRTPGGFEVLAIDGADGLGGLDLDQALLTHLSRSVQPQDERWRRLTEPTALEDFRFRTALLEEVRLAKERLSRRPFTDLTLPLLDTDVHLTREELDQVARPLLERTVRFTQGVIRESGLGDKEIAGLFLVGAASRTPLAATLLHQEIGIAPAAVEQPELVVSEGALSAPAVTATPPRGLTSPPPQHTPAPSPAPAAAIQYNPVQYSPASPAPQSPAPATTPPAALPPHTPEQPSPRNETPGPPFSSKIRKSKGPLITLVLVAAVFLAAATIYIVNAYAKGFAPGDCVQVLDGESLDYGSAYPRINDNEVEEIDCSEAESNPGDNAVYKVVEVGFGAGLCAEWAGRLVVDTSILYHCLEGV